MKIKFAFLVLLFACSFSIFFSTSCNKDKLPKVENPDFCDTIQVSYNLNIKPIVDTYCAYAGCHDGSAPGDYSIYSGLLSNLEAGTIEDRVIDLHNTDNSQRMPPPYAVAGLDTIPQAEYEMLSCWILTGYPEEL